MSGTATAPSNQDLIRPIANHPLVPHPIAPSSPAWNSTASSHLDTGGPTLPPRVRSLHRRRPRGSSPPGRGIPSPAPARPGPVSGRATRARRARGRGPYQTASASTAARADAQTGAAPASTIVGGRGVPRARSDGRPAQCSRSGPLAVAPATPQRTGVRWMTSGQGRPAAQAWPGCLQDLVSCGEKARADRQFGFNGLSSQRAGGAERYRRFVLEDLGEPVLAGILNLLCIRCVTAPGLV